ncbi:hypothetical protein [uncultured Sphingomonas sp.]|uniref:hypothetical protein n=1 Tax=uncultured Sphingomonas sp. TaxID=158754 RepID=UPI0025E932F3|nr:hypothetical protein [uncultured Sphingomonas sp.]
MKASNILLALSLAGTVLTLSACDRNRRAAEATVRESLKDPESARFGDFYFNSKTEKACLTTNAKNSMGGYTGDRQVHLQKFDNRWEYIGEIEEGVDDCRKSYADDARSPEQQMQDMTNALGS